MKLKSIFMAALVTSAVSSFAAPINQTCSPMEILNAGNVGLSYNLACAAGDFNLTYTGSIPAGANPVTAQYRVHVTNKNGVDFTTNRSVRLGEPALLGQSLQREAVLIDEGTLALRDCPELNCTMYRPVTTGGKLTQASITITPEVKRLHDERSRLMSDLVARTTEVEAHQKDLAACTETLTQTTKDAEALNTAVHAIKKTADADSLALRNEISQLKLQLEKQEASHKEATAEAVQQTLTAMYAQLNTAIADRDAQKELLTKANQANTAHLTEVEQSYRQVIASLEKTNSEIYTELENLKKQNANLSAQVEAVAAYEFVVSDLVAQHNTQVKLVQEAFPGHDINKLLSELSVPKVTKK